MIKEFKNKKWLLYEIILCNSDFILNRGANNSR